MSGLRGGLLAVAVVVPTLCSEAAAAETVVELSPEIRNQCLQVLRAGMRSDEFWPSIHAAEGLTLAGHGREVIEFLEPLLERESDGQRRCGIARELARAGQRHRTRVMLDILAGEDPYAHVHAAESLYKVFEIGDGEAMRRAFTQDEPRLKLMSAGALARCGNPAALAYLRRMLEHEDPDLYRLAAWVLGRIGDQSDIARLQKLLPRCEDPLVAAFVQYALAALGDSQAQAVLLENLDSDDAAIRTYAATFASDARVVAAAPALRRMLEDTHLDARLRAAQSLLVLSQPAPPDSDGDISQIVFASTEQNPRYTEGSIVELSDGSLLFAVTEFQNSGSDFAAAHIIGRASNDGGRSWSQPRVLHRNTGGMNVMSVTLRRLQGDRKAGEQSAGPIAMFYLQKNDFDDLDLYVRRSDDECQTFGEPVLVTTDAGYHVVNNDRITQLASGRLLAPAASTPDVKKVNHFVSHCYISDDGGATWRPGKGSVDAAKRGAMEPEVIELQDGRVLMIVRTQLGFIGHSISKDGGDTWSPMKSLGVRAPEAPATLRRIPATGHLLLVWNDNYQPGAGHSGRRTPLSLAISGDEGRTWSKVMDLETDSSRTFSYPSLIFVRDRAVLSYWDSKKSGQYSCRFRSLPVSRLYD